MPEYENTVERVMPNSAADRAGIVAGDRILSINGKKIKDAIDLMYYSDADILEVLIERDKKRIKIKLTKSEQEPLGVQLSPLKVRTCRNRCVFCFVSQLPRGLRRSLYIKDEDFRMSFLYGNYITLTNLSKADKKRIVQQHLSPLYISVHSTDPEIRNRLLGNKKAPPIMDELQWLAEHRIKMHTQIVLCPGYNDGENLKQTIQDLIKLYPYVQSVAVVPVGVTRFVRTDIRPLTQQEAQEAIKVVHDFQKKLLKKYGDPIVYGADELYIKAGVAFPSLRYYGDFPQIENGVGMVPQFISKARRLKPLKGASSDKRYAVVTGVSFYPYLKEFIDRISNGREIIVVPVENQFFGRTVTVTGLLTGRDIIRQLSGITDRFDTLLIPDVTVQEGGTVLIDDVRVEDIARILQKEIIITESTPRGLLKALEVGNEDKCVNKTHRNNRVSCQA